MSQENERAKRIVAEAEALIAKVQREQDEREAFYREHGIDRDALISAMSPEQKAEAARLVAEDMADIERAVEEEKSRLAFSNSSPAKRPGTPRSMV